MKLDTAINIGLLAIGTSAYLAIPEPECGEGIDIRPVHVPPHGMGDWGFRHGERVSEEDYQCAADAQHYHRYCKPVRDETSARVAQILLSDCEPNGISSNSNFDGDFYNLSTVQNTKGDCSETVAESEAKLRLMKTECEE